MGEGTIRAADLKRLCHLLTLDVDQVVVDPLSGGLSNRTFRLSHGASSWAVRLPLDVEERRFQTLDVGMEQQLLDAVSGAGLTPAVVLCDSSTGALVTEYLGSAVPWTAEAARRPENLRRIAATLRSLHDVAVPESLSPFRPVMLAEQYLDSARRTRGKRVSADEKRWARDLRALAAVYEKRFPPSIICHHDLVAANILEDRRLWLVDFEYARRAHPILDLASLAGMNGYDATQCALLSEAYFDAGPIPFRAEQLHDVVRLERLLSYFWAVSRHGDFSRDSGLSRFADSMAAMLR